MARSINKRNIKNKQELEERNLIDIDVNVNKEEAEDALCELKETMDIKPNITIRHNKNVYVTINYFNETEKEYTRMNPNAE